MLCISLVLLSLTLSWFFYFGGVGEGSCSMLYVCPSSCSSVLVADFVAFRRIWLLVLGGCSPRYVIFGVVADPDVDVLSHKSLHPSGKERAKNTVLT